MREFDLLEHVFAANPSLLKSAGGLLIPPGDDMAMIRLGGRELLAAVDQLIAGRHVNLATTPLHLVGRKAVTRSLSDIAAMACRPVATLVAVTLPPDFGKDRATALFDAMRETADQYHCPLIGGDIAIHADRSHPLVCSVTVLAEPAVEPVRIAPVTRSGAQPGDNVYVTGTLGGSVAPDGLGKHLTFEPRIREAVALAAALGSHLHAMIDVSDGLGRDAMHIAERSNVAVELDASLIPCSEGVDWRRAMSDGEDYELCFTAAGEVPVRIGDLPVTRVGKVVELARNEKPRCIVRDGEQVIDASAFGWQHESP